MQDAWLKCFNWISTFISSIFIDILQVNNNGYISFGEDYHHSRPTSFPIKQTIIAPFWADIDNTCYTSGDVYYRETTAKSILANVSNDIQSSLSLSSDFYPSSVVIATWHQVEHFKCSSDDKVRIMDVYHKCQLITIITLLTDLSHSVQE